MSESSDLERLLGDLVAARSPNPPGDERAVAAVIESAAAEIGLAKPRRLGPRPERPNLIYEIGSGTPRLLIAAHMDTMPTGDVEAWESDPFELTRAGDRLVGLGSADMKAAIAAMLGVAARLKAKQPPRGTLVLAFTADEETGSSEGMGWLCDRGEISADAAVMAEPASTSADSWEALFVAQRGSCICELVATGKPGHSGERVPSGERASTPFAAAMTALIESEAFADLVHPVDGTTPTLNVGTIVQGGEVPFAHPPELRATIDVRTISGMTPELVISRLEAVLADAGLGDRTRIEPGPGTSWISPGETVTDAALLGAASGAWRSVHGSEPRHAVLSAGTDSSIVDALGIPTLPALGPGTLAVAHRPNESLPREDLELATDLLERFARDYLGDGG